MLAVAWFFALRAKKTPKWGSLSILGVFSLREKTKIARGSAFADPRPLFSRFARKKVYGLNFLAVWGMNLFFPVLRAGQIWSFKTVVSRPFSKRPTDKGFKMGYYSGPRLRSGRVKKGHMEGHCCSDLGRALEGRASATVGRAYARQRFV